MNNKSFFLAMACLVFCGCAALLDTKKDITIVEDIIDDIVKEETGFDLKLSPSDQ